jgi:hypothetical protein
MALRWTAAGMLEAAKGFRRLKAYKHLPVLRTALMAHQAKYVTQRVERTLMPHSIFHSDACFAYFNKNWGIPAQSGLTSPSSRQVPARLCRWKLSCGTFPHIFVLVITTKLKVSTIGPLLGG